jgi:carboxyl-terminal processing protease
MRRNPWIAGLFVLLVTAFALGLALTRARDSDPSSLEAGARDRPPTVVDEVRRELLLSYYRSVPPAALHADSVEELLTGLRDPYTEYLTPSEYDSLKSRTAKSYSGIGLTVRPEKGGLVVKAALRGPARKAGIRPGDRIVSIDGRRVRRLPVDRSLELIKGKQGTTVRLMVRRPREGTLSFTVKRIEIPLPAGRSRLIRGKNGTIGHVRLLSFRSNAAETVTRRTRNLVARGAQGLVLDLRDNPGGLLSQAVRTVSLFVEDGIVCFTEGLHHGRRVYSTTGRAIFAGLPVVVLVDSGSASAAEVVAAALADHDRGVVVGQQTYGKASVQSLRDLSNGAALKLTTAVFLTPDGENLTHRGLAPHVVALDDPETTADEALATARRALLKQLAR